MFWLMQLLFVWHTPTQASYPTALAFLPPTVNLQLLNRRSKAYGHIPDVETITPTNRPSSNLSLFSVSAGVWVDAVAQHHTWSTPARCLEGMEGWGKGSCHRFYSYKWRLKMKRVNY